MRSIAIQTVRENGKRITGNAMDLMFHPPGPGSERQLRGTLSELDDN